MSIYTEDLNSALQIVKNKNNVNSQQFFNIDLDTHTVSFTIQDGGVKEFGINGCQILDVLEFVKAFIELRAKQFPCRENSMTITKLDEAILWQHKRTSDRIQRNVEGLDIK